MAEKPRTRSGAGTAPPQASEKSAGNGSEESEPQQPSPPPALEQEELVGEPSFGDPDASLGDEEMGEEEDCDPNDSVHQALAQDMDVAEGEPLDSPEAPLFSPNCLSFSEVEKILLGEGKVPKNKICTHLPNGEREKKRPSSTYVIDLAAIGDFKNVLNDALSPWHAGYGASATSGSLTRHFTLDADGKATRVDKGHKLPKGQKSDLRIARTLYTNKAAKSLGGRLLRYIYRCLARNGQLRRFVVVCFEWKSPITDFDHLLADKDMSAQVVYPISRHIPPPTEADPNETEASIDSSAAAAAAEGEEAVDPSVIYLSHDDLIPTRVEVEESEPGSDAEEDEEEESGDPACPIYSKKAISFDDVEKILLGAERVPKNLICSKTPEGERERKRRSGSYIVDLAAMPSPNDILLDKLGPWQSGTGGERSCPGTNSSGSRMRYYCLKTDGGALRVDKHGRKPPKEIRFDLKINRCLYTNRSAREAGGRLVRRIFRCFTRQGETRRFAVVTYEWIGQITPFEVLPPLKRGRKPGISPRRKSDLYLTKKLAAEDSAEGGPEDPEDSSAWGDVVQEEDIEVGASTTVSPGPAGASSIGGLRGPGLGRAPLGIPASATVLPPRGKKRPLPGLSPARERQDHSESESQKHEAEMRVLVLQEKYLQYKLYKTTLEIRQLNPDFDPEAFEEGLVQEPRAALAAARERINNPQQQQLVVVAQEGQGSPAAGPYLIRTSATPQGGTYVIQE